MLTPVGLANFHLRSRTVHDDERSEFRVVTRVRESNHGNMNFFWYNHYRSVADFMPLMKHQLIPLVRLAQRETNPRRREVMWQLVRESGIPADATVVEGEYIGEEPLKDEPKKDTLKA